MLWVINTICPVRYENSTALIHFLYKKIARGIVVIFHCHSNEIKIFFLPQHSLNTFRISWNGPPCLTSVLYLTNALVAEWAQILTAMLQYLLESLSRRMEVIIAAKWDLTWNEKPGMFSKHIFNFFVNNCMCFVWSTNDLTNELDICPKWSSVWNRGGLREILMSCPII